MLVLKPCSIQVHWLTGFLKLLVDQPPGLSDAKQVFLQSVQVGVWTVTLRKVHTALAPAVPVLADKLAFGLAADVVKSRLYEEALQVAREDDLQPWGRGGGWVGWMRQNEKYTFWETRRTCKRIKSKSLRGFYLVAGPCFQDCGPARSWQCPDCHSCCTRGVRCGFLLPAKRWKQQDAVKTLWTFFHKTCLLRQTIGPLWCHKGHPACLSDHVTTPSVRCWHQHHLLCPN